MGWTVEELTDTSSRRKNITVRVKPDFHKLVKLHAMQQDESLQSYVLKLIIKDMEKQEGE